MSLLNIRYVACKYHSLLGRQLCIIVKLRDPKEKWCKWYLILFEVPRHKFIKRILNDFKSYGTNIVIDRVT